MKYFMIEADKSYPLPQIKNWYNKLNPKTISEARYDELPDFISLHVEPNEKAFYSDVISFPFFMINKEASRIISCYDSDLKFLEVYLFDTTHKGYELYLLPRLEIVDCLAKNTLYAKDKKTVIKPVIIMKNVLNRILFRPAGLSRTCAIIHVDLAESLLRRDIRGMALTEIEII